MHEEAKQKYEIDLNHIKHLLHEFDPIGFIYSEIPDDEYDQLIKHILSYLYSNKSQEKIKASVLKDIEHYYGSPNLINLVEPFKTEFYNDLEKLLHKLTTEIKTNLN